MKYAVKCQDYKTTPVATREQAEARKRRIEEAGACRHEHRIVEVRGSRAQR